VPEQVVHLRVPWVDTDASGRIHWTAPLRWAETAEARLVEQLGYLDDWARFPRRHVEVEYLRALRFDDALEVRLGVGRIGTTSITFRWEVVCEGSVCIRGSHTTVHIDADGRPATLPETVRALG
jgi:YbgC/YbaW family acyl-CoA thioester hydrolase